MKRITMAKPEYIAMYRVDETTKEANIHPVVCHRTPARIPPTSAEPSLTLIFGIKI